MYVKIVSFFFYQESTTKLKTVIFILVVFLLVFGSLFQVHFANLLMEIMGQPCSINRTLAHLELAHINIS